MNSMFSSFDALCAEFLGQTVKPSFPISQQQSKTSTSALNNKVSDQKRVCSPEAGQVKKQQKSAPPRRFAVELDGLHCFETLV